MKLPHEDPAVDAELLRRWPHLKKPGPQPWNCEVFDTFEEQLAFAKKPRPTRRERWQREILELMAEPVGKLVMKMIGSRKL